jgi:cell division protein FtsB
MATIIGSVLSALIVGGIALLIWGISTLIRFHDRLARVDFGQANLAEDVAELKVSQVKLTEDVAELKVGQAKLTEDAESRPGETDRRRNATESRPE